MRLTVAALAAAGLVAGSPLSAQSVIHWPAPGADTTAVPGGATYFPIGTPITLRTRVDLNTKAAKAGDRVQLEVAENLTYRGQIVVPIGAPAFAEVARSERNGHFGKRGEIMIRLLYVETPSGPVRLAGEALNRGRSGTAASVATIAFVSPLGFLIHGTSGKLPFGTAVVGSISEPLRFASRPVAQVAVALPTDTAPVMPDR